MEEVVKGCERVLSPLAEAYQAALLLLPGWHAGAPRLRLLPDREVVHPVWVRVRVRVSSPGPRGSPLTQTQTLTLAPHSRWCISSGPASPPCAHARCQQTPSKMAVTSECCARAGGGRCDADLSVGGSARTSVVMADRVAGTRVGGGRGDGTKCRLQDLLRPLSTLPSAQRVLCLTVLRRLRAISFVIGLFHA